MILGFHREEGKAAKQAGEKKEKGTNPIVILVL
jgi:hypothetical protein